MSIQNDSSKSISLADLESNATDTSENRPERISDAMMTTIPHEAEGLLAEKYLGALDDHDGSDEVSPSDDEIELENDLEESAEAELKDLLSETGGSILIASENLTTKLALEPSGEFPVSKHSQYIDDTWKIFETQDGFATNLHFDHYNENFNALKKCISYYALPDNAPFSRIRSFNTTRAIASHFRLLIKYVFEPNFLDGSQESLRIITHKTLNKAIIAAREVSSNTYRDTFYIIRLWVSLSAQELIPEGYRISVDFNKVDTPERRTDMYNVFSGTIGSWKPFSEAELGALIDYARYWTEDALPHLIGYRNFIKSNKIDQEYASVATRFSPDPELEKSLTLEVNGVRLISPRVNSRSYEGSSRKLKSTSYTWLSPYANCLNHVRNSVFIWTAIITGLRVSEISQLKFDDLIQNEQGEFSLKVTRYKTANDPNIGDEDIIPIPKFVGEKILEMKLLRNISRLDDRDFLFQSCKGRKKVRKQNLQRMLAEISELTKIDHLHVHRFRKTIAEIIINRNERNIDLIRLLFGHKSYAMTLSYIGRNPYLVRSVALAIEQNYTAEFTDLISEIKNGKSSGASGLRIAERLEANENAFTGKQLRLTIFNYVTSLLSSGEPLFVHRTAVGSYCLSSQTYSSPYLPPCLKHLASEAFDMLPDPTRCDTKCEHAVITQKAKLAMADNIKFYSTMLERASDTLSERSKKMIRAKIAANTEHLDNLNQGIELIPAGQVEA